MQGHPPSAVRHAAGTRHKTQTFVSACGLLPIAFPRTVEDNQN